MANFFDNVGQKAKGFTETTKLNGELSKLQQQRQQMFAQLGQMYYEHKKNDSAPEPDYTPMISAIDNVNANTRAIEERIATIKGGTVCQKCSGIVPQGNKFCPHCGAEMPVMVQPAQPFGQPPFGQPPMAGPGGGAPMGDGMGMTPPRMGAGGSACVNCGAPLAPGVKFCAKCGTPTGAGATPQPAPAAFGAEAPSADSGSDEAQTPAED